jgi:hypothetical protein
MPRYKSWEQIRREIDLNEEHVAAYGLLDEAERRFYEARQRRGFTDAMMARALGREEEDGWAIEAEDGDLFLAALARHVAAAGGRLELRAVFDDEEVLLLSEPASTKKESQSSDRS